MSLATYSFSSKSKASGRASQKHKARVVPDSLRKALAAFGRLCVNIFDAIAEARVQKAMIEAELYRKRYLHTSKNDDDLPIVR